MKNGIDKTVYLIVAVLLVAATTATTVDELINSYNYDFISDLNVTYSDSIQDMNSNSLNDTLIIQIQKNSTAGQLTYVTIYDSVPITVLVNSSNQTVNAKFDTYMLNQDKWNYSIEIYDANNYLLYRKYNLTTSSYQNVEQAFTLSVTDHSDDGYLILNVDSTIAKQVNIGANLQLDKLYVFTLEYDLNVGQNAIYFDFDNETLKKSHHVGVSTLQQITIDNKAFPQSIVSLFDYQWYALESYIQSYSISKNDNDNDGLFDELVITPNVVDLSSSQETVYANLYYDNELQLTSSSQSAITIPASKIYSTYKTGEFSLNLILSNGTVLDSLQDIPVNLSYYNFEKPALPDLVPVITNNTIVIQNNGNMTAFDVQVDIIHNNNITTYYFTQINDSVTIPKLYQDYFVVVVDSINSVDEINETNNIVFNVVPVSADVTYTKLHENETTFAQIKVVFSEYISSINVTLLNKTINYGSAKEIYTLFEHNSSLEDLEINVSNILETTLDLSYVVGNITNFSKIASEGPMNFIEMQINADQLDNYTIETNGNTYKDTKGNAWVILPHNYSSFDTQAVTVTMNYGEAMSSVSKYIEVLPPFTLTSSLFNSRYELILENKWSNKPINWSLNGNNGSSNLAIGDKHYIYSYVINDTFAADNGIYQVSKSLE